METVNATQTFKVNDTVKYVTPFSDEVGISYLVIDIIEDENYIVVRALGSGFAIPPSHNGKISDFKLA